MNKRIRKKRAKRFGRSCPECGGGNCCAMGPVNGPYEYFVCDTCGHQGPP